MLILSFFQLVLYIIVTISCGGFAWKKCVNWTFKGRQLLSLIFGQSWQPRTFFMTFSFDITSADGYKLQLNIQQLKSSTESRTTRRCTQLRFFSFTDWFWGLLFFMDWKKDVHHLHMFALVLILYVYNLFSWMWLIMTTHVWLVFIWWKLKIIYLPWVSSVFSFLLPKNFNVEANVCDSLSCLLSWGQKATLDLPFFGES